MSRFEEARRKLNAEAEAKAKAEQAAEQQKLERLTVLRDEVIAHFGGSNPEIIPTLKGYTLTISRDNKDYIDITALDGEDFRMKMGGVGQAALAKTIVRDGVRVKEDEVHETILEWVDGNI